LEVYDLGADQSLANAQLQQRLRFTYGKNRNWITSPCWPKSVRSCSSVTSGGRFDRCNDVDGGVMF